jgi:hypothetical protein
MPDELDRSHQPVAPSSGGGETPPPLAGHPPGRGPEHGLRAGTGGDAHSARDTRPDRARRFSETTYGLLSYSELAWCLRNSCAVAISEMPHSRGAAADLKKREKSGLRGGIPVFVPPLVPQSSLKIRLRLGIVSGFRQEIMYAFVALKLARGEARGREGIYQSELAAACSTPMKIATRLHLPVGRRCVGASISPRRRASPRKTSSAPAGSMLWKL